MALSVHGPVRTCVIAADSNMNKAIALWRKTFPPSERTGVLLSEGFLPFDRIDGQWRRILARIKFLALARRTYTSARLRRYCAASGSAAARKTARPKDPHGNATA